MPEAKVISLRMLPDDLARLQRLQERLQARAEPHTVITQRLTVLHALDALEAKLDKLDRDRERER